MARCLQRLAQWMEVEESEIIKSIRSSPYLHIDETGWKICGTNHWLWNFVNERLALYRIRRSRGRKIPKEVLTAEYDGIVISDGLSAYDNSGKRRQRCLVHIERDMDKYVELDTSTESKRAYKKLKRILNDARRLDASRNDLDIWVFVRRSEKLKKRLLDYSCGLYKNRNWAKLARRILKHNEELLAFLDVPGLPKDNNHVERMIRQCVVIRKMCYQNMSTKGARALEVLMTLLQTLRLQKKDPIEFFKTSYLKHRKGDKTPIIVT